MSVAPARAGSIVDRYDALICDLDGVVYRGKAAVPGAVDALNRVLASGRAVRFATNNASREPAVVEAHLTSLGLEVGDWRVISSAQAAARFLAARLPTRTPVLAVGGPGVAHALREVGLVPFATTEAGRHDQVAAVVQGAGSEVSWRDLAEVAHQVRGGAAWVATNPDLTIPTSRGLAPGNGSLVAAVRAAVDVEPTVVGKPAPHLYELALEGLSVERSRVLVVGDRLDTDVAAATAAGLDSLFVLGGAHGLADLLPCPPSARPTYLGTGVAALLDPRSDPSAPGTLDSVVNAAWRAMDAGGRLASEPLGCGTCAPS